MSEQIKRYVYKSHHDMTVVVKPTSHQPVLDSNGTVRMYLTIQPIKLVFNSCHCIVDERFAKQHKFELKDLAAIIEYAPGFGKKFWVIESPKKAEPKVEEAIKASRKKAPIKQGARS